MHEYQFAKVNMTPASQLSIYLEKNHQQGDKGKDLFSDIRKTVTLKAHWKLFVI